MSNPVPSLLFEVSIGIGVVLVVCGSVAVFSWIGSRFRDRPSRSNVRWPIDPGIWEPSLPPHEPTMFGKVSHGERITDSRVTVRAPVDPMLSDPIDERPKDLKG